jgi:SAM-dependent methyltransferase
VTHIRDSQATSVPGVELEAVACPLRCAGDDELVVTGTDRISNLPGDYQVVRCRSCGLMRTSPRPTAATIGFYYPDTYGPYVGTQIAPESGQRLGELKRLIVAAGRRLFDIKAHDIPPLPPGRMLEVGCASGSYMHKMSQEGWQVEGVEFSPKAAEAARALGFVVDVGAVETINKPSERYDLIVGWMVLEHLHDPIASLRKFARWTRPGGMLAISVPDAGAAEFRWFGSKWYALQVPNHLFHFDEATLTKVLEAGGWRPVRFQRHRTISNVVASAGYWAYDRGHRRIGRWMIDFPERGGRLGSALLYPVSLAMAVAGQTGRMTVWAERLPK